MTTISSDIDFQYLRSQEFPLAAECAFLNHAGSSPLPARSARALTAYAARAQRKHLRYKANAEDYDCGPLRRLVAATINADPSEITFVPSTCDGVAIAANAIDWRPGDNVVLPECEYPGVVYPWLNLARRGVEARLVPAPLGHVDMDALSAAIDGRTRAVSISHVQWASGYLVDVVRLGQICRSRGILLVVDAIQSLGATPVDVQQMQADVLVAGCYKWLMGIPGAAVFYVRRDAMPALVPDRAGQESVCTSLMDRPALVWKEDAMRYQVGGDCTAAQVVLEQSLGLLVEASVERIHVHVVALLDRLIAALRRLGFTVTSSLGPQTRSTILSFTTGDLKRDEALRAHLLQRDVITALRPYGIRVSPHLYNAPEDIDALIEALQAA